MLKIFHELKRLKQKNNERHTAEWIQPNGQHHYEADPATIKHETQNIKIMFS